MSCMVGVAQLVRAPVCGTGGCGFKSCKGWAIAYTDNEDEDIISDYSANKFMDKWANQFTKFHEELSQILNNENW